MSRDTDNAKVMDLAMKVQNMSNKLGNLYGLFAAEAMADNMKRTEEIRLEIHSTMDAMMDAQLEQAHIVKEMIKNSH